MSGLKLSIKHQIVKCGFICTTCKQVHRYQDKLEQMDCTCGEGHTIVSSALMCSTCGSLSDDMESFKQEICTPTEKPIIDMEKEKILAELGLAQRELEKLLLLKEVQEEEARLQDLLHRQKQRESIRILFAYLLY